MRIYLDHNAGTALRPTARDAMARFLADDLHGNPASVHRSGQRARAELERARASVANLVGAPARTITFTSGGTEANNLAIFGAARFAHVGRRRTVITSQIEHSSILAPLTQLERESFEVVKVAPDRDGCLDGRAIARIIDDGTALLTLGLVNTEVGTIQNLTAVAEAAARTGALLHIDAAQAVGRISVRVNDFGCDLMTLSAHKLGGPAGIGALYVRPATGIAAHLLGGPQENGLRAGTPNLAGAIGFGAAAEAVVDQVESEQTRIAELSEMLFRRLHAAIPALTLNGPRSGRVSNTLNLAFPGVLGESMLIALDLAGVEVSMGSACAAGAVEPSHVLIAMGRDAAQARSSLRISLGWCTTADEIERAAEIIPRVWRRVAAAEPRTDAEALR